ncbi:hypothetical protein [Catellatospora methionotrophica]|uniref:hypothetical protein n=1 Tax=Catellatospora methionotrophica TaxID=121620 RepID=UPI0033FC89FD
MNDLRMEAARAHARGGLIDSLSPVFLDLEPTLWRTVALDEHHAFTVATELQPSGVARPDVPVASLTGECARVMLAALVATQSSSEHPWPGRTSTVGDVFAILGSVVKPDDGPHVRRALYQLRTWNLIAFGDEGTEPAGPAMTLRLGWAAGLWSGPWVRDLMVAVTTVSIELGQQ